MHSHTIKYSISTNGFRGHNGGSVFDLVTSSNILSEREGRGGGDDVLYLYMSWGTFFMFSSTGRLPVVCISVCLYE